MNIALWILQVLLAFAFGVHAYGMFRPSPQRLQQGGMKYILEMPRALRLFAGAAEALAALALILPALFRVLVWLTPLAATGLIVLMVGAIIFHIRRREYPNVGLNAALGVLAAITAWGRFGPYNF